MRISNDPEYLRAVMARAGEAQHNNIITPDDIAGDYNPHLILRRKQHAPIGDGVRDLRPLRGRPFGPILDTAASSTRPETGEEPTQRDQLQEHGVDRPHPLQG